MVLFIPLTGAAAWSVVWVYVRVHRWFAAAVQVQRMTVVPLAVALPLNVEAEA